MENVRKKETNKVQTMAFIALTTAAIAVLSLISIPMPTGVPVTLQTYAVAFAGYFLGARKGTVSVALYVLIGTIGLPVFSGMKGGFSVITGPTGGFIWGFLIFALLCGVMSRNQKSWLPLLLGLIGLAVCHALGTLQYSILSGRPYWEALLLVSLPYWIKDIVSLILAYFAARQTNKILKKSKKEIRPSTI